MTFAVKTVENLFIWCGHERYKVMMEQINLLYRHPTK